jgi:hypothetical protein
VHDSRPGFEVCGISLAGRAEVPVGDEARRFVDLVHRRYVAPVAEEHGSVREFLESDDVAIRFTPEVALTWDERGSAEARRCARPEEHCRWSRRTRGLSYFGSASSL